MISFVTKIWSTVVDFCPIPINGNLILDRIELIWKSGNVYKKKSPLEKILVIAYSIWISRNNVYLIITMPRQLNISNLVVKSLDDIRSYNNAFSIFDQYCIACTHTDSKKNVG